MNTTVTENIRNQTTEHTLIGRIQEGSLDSFAKLYDKYAPVLHGVILKITGDKKAAEDILQQSFMRLWMEINSFDPGKESLLMWMLTITRNTAFTAAPQKNKTGEIRQPGNSVNSVNPDLTPITAVTATHSSHTGRSSALELVYFKGYTLTRAANELNMSVDALKTRIRMEFKRPGGIKSNG